MQTRVCTHQWVARLWTAPPVKQHGGTYMKILCIKEKFDCIIYNLILYLFPVILLVFCKLRVKIQGLLWLVLLCRLTPWLGWILVILCKHTCGQLLHTNAWWSPGMFLLYSSIFQCPRVQTSWRLFAKPLTHPTIRNPKVLLAFGTCVVSSTTPGTASTSMWNSKGGCRSIVVALGQLQTSTRSTKCRDTCLRSSCGK